MDWLTAYELRGRPGDVVHTQRQFQRQRWREDTMAHMMSRTRLREQTVVHWARNRHGFKRWIS